MCIVFWSPRMTAPGKTAQFSSMMTSPKMTACLSMKLVGCIFGGFMVCFSLWCGGICRCVLGFLVVAALVFKKNHKVFNGAVVFDNN